MGSREDLELQIRILNSTIEEERLARAAVTDLLRHEKNKNARATAHINTLTEMLESARHSLDHAQSKIEYGINCFQAANSTVNHAQEQLGSAIAFPLPGVPQNSRLQIILPTHGEVPAQPKLQARVNPMVQGVQIRKPSIQLFRLSSSMLLDYNDNAASSSATAATATTPPSQQAAIPQVSLGNEHSLQESANTAMSSDTDFDPNDVDGGTTTMVQRSLRRSSRLRRH